jgi:hypothetical protein
MKSVEELYEAHTIRTNVSQPDVSYDKLGQ